MPEKDLISKLEDAELIERIWADYRESKDTSSYWRQEAEEDYNFAAGHQWGEDDITKLKNENRPIITFNRIVAILSAVLGIEANQRHETTYSPRETTDSGLNEALTNVAKWMREYGEVDVEDATSFEDMLTCGLGWSESRMEYDVDLDGKFIQERIDPFEMFWDSTAKKRNLIDRHWQIRARKLTKEEVLDLWPEAELNTTEDIDAPENNTLSVIDPANRYENESGNSSGKAKPYTVLHYQWYETEPVYRAQNPATGEIITLSEEKFKEAKPLLEIGGARTIKQKKRIYHQAFVCGKELLEHGLCSTQSGFSINCLTGKHDKIKNQWYGLVRVMKDPQRWSNKFFSQILDIINSNAKGGIIFEEGSFSDQRKAENDWARADSMIAVKMGTIANSRIMPKPITPYPQGLERLMQFAITAVREVPGVNLEMLGMADREQAGVVEETRKKAAYSILATFFDSLKSFRKGNGFLVLEFIVKYIPESTLQRVLAPQYRQFIPVIKKLSLDAVDVVVTEAPQSENNKALVWTFITQVAPFLIKAGVPVPPEILEYSPLPLPLVETWKSALANVQANPEEQKAKQMQMEKVKGETRLKNAQADKENMETFMMGVSGMGGAA